MKTLTQHINEWKYKSGDEVKGALFKDIDINNMDDFVKKYMLTKNNKAQNYNNYDNWYCFNMSPGLTNLVFDKVFVATNNGEKIYRIFKNQYDELKYPFDFQLSTNIMSDGSNIMVTIQNGDRNSSYSDNMMGCIDISITRKEIVIWGKDISTMLDLISMLDNIVTGKVTL